MAFSPDSSGNWFQQLLARLTGRDATPEPAAPSRFGAMGTVKTPEQVAEGRAQALRDMMEFREQHERDQAGNAAPAKKE